MGNATSAAGRGARETPRNARDPAGQRTGHHREGGWATPAALATEREPAAMALRAARLACAEQGGPLHGEPPPDNLATEVEHRTASDGRRGKTAATRPRTNQPASQEGGEEETNQPTSRRPTRAARRQRQPETSLRNRRPAEKPRSSPRSKGRHLLPRLGPGRQVGSGAQPKGKRIPESLNPRMGKCAACENLPPQNQSLGMMKILARPLPVLSVQCARTDRWATQRVRPDGELERPRGMLETQCWGSRRTERQSQCCRRERSGVARRRKRRANLRTAVSSRAHRRAEAQSERLRRSFTAMW